MPMTDLPEYVETLNEVLSRQAASWTDGDLEKIVAGFREVRERWNLEQNAGSRKLVRSSKVEVGKATVKNALADLML